MWGVLTPKEAFAKINEQKSEAIAAQKGREPQNLEEQALTLVGKDIFEKLIKEYTEKQWGRKCSELPAFIIKRLPVRLVFDNNYFNDKYQGIPIGGYNKLINCMLDGIECKTNVDFFKSEYKNNWRNIAKQLIYTGAIDELFNYEFGKLPYRSLTFKYETLNEELFQATPVVAYPQVEGYTRITEYKQLPKQNILGITTIAYEYPMMFEEGKADEPYYPVPTDDTAMLYSKYKAKAGNYDNLILCGRLANYKYYNMDQAILAVLRLT